MKYLSRLILSAMAVMLLVPAFSVSAAGLEIYNIQIVIEGNNAIIRWETNVQSNGWVDFGLTQNYDFRLSDNSIDKYIHSVKLQNLEDTKTYHFKITAKTAFEQTSTFDGIFKTKEGIDTNAPKLNGVSAYYVTGTLAAIRWETDEPATSVVRYGTTANYGKTAGSSSRVTSHEVILKGLQLATVYHFNVESKDEDGNVATYVDQSFRTNLTGDAENLLLEITRVRPVAVGDPAIGLNSASVSWQTNKLTDGIVRYGKTEKLGKSSRESTPRQFFHTVRLEGLEAGTVYYFQVEAKDVYGKSVKSGIMSFKTLTVSAPVTVPAPVVAGSSTMDPLVGIAASQLRCEEIDFNLHQGFYGTYYNFRSKFPYFKAREATTQEAIKNSGWYPSQNFVFYKIDRNLDFGKKFFPVNTGLKQDPHYFSAIWKSIMYVPADNTYELSTTSDDDSWVFIDGIMVINLSGSHSPKNAKNQVHLTRGYHRVEIYYADRALNGATMVFAPDSRLLFYALPEGCEINQIVSRQTGIVASAEFADVTEVTVDGPYNKPAHQISPYTRATALYRISGTPDVYAILNGQKHYISGPTSFAEYGYRWSDVEDVSAEFLARIPDARLLRHPNDPTVYHIYQRPDRKWLKISIPSPTVFVSYPQNYWGNIVVVNNYDLQAYPDVRFVQSTDSTTLYLLSDQTIFPFLSEIAFMSHGYNISEVAKVSPEHLNAYQQGEAIGVKTAF